MVDYTRSDVHMYHELKEQAKKMVEVFSFLEMVEYKACIFYEVDAKAFEEQCTCKKINRLGKEFCAETECWLCSHYKSKEAGESG